MNESQLAVQEKPTAPRPLITADSRGVQFSTMEDMFRFCTAVANSGQFKDISSPEVALIRLQAGLELGLSPIWSLTNIMVTNGRPSVWGDALLGIVLNHPDCEDVIETTEGVGDRETAVCEVHRRGRLPVIRRFGVADAKLAGLQGNGVHGKYPQRMRQMRARAWACRDAFADALRGLGVREEMERVEPKPVTARVVSAVAVLPDEPEPVAVDTPEAKPEVRDAEGNFVW